LIITVRANFAPDHGAALRALENAMLRFVIQPRDIFGDLDGKLAVLEIVCEKCKRLGRYSVRRLIEQHGRDARLTDWISDHKATCPLKRSMSDPCAANRPDLLRIA
jgi:hypothetical protein